MSSTRSCLVLILLLAACGAPPASKEAALAVKEAAPAAREAAPAAKEPVPPKPPPAPVAVAKEPAKPAPAAKAAPPVPPKSAPAAKAAPAAKPAPPAPVAARSSPPPLDLTSLEQRLKATNAVGVLTKLSLKNQVDDLVARFRAFHSGQRPPTLGELRPSFELLLMKVLSLLQDKDTALAKDIDASRNAIWEVLADRDKLAKIN